MNEINKLIWPSPDGIGVIVPGRLGPHGRGGPQHQERPRARRCITKEPDAEAFTNEYVEKALAELNADLDMKGDGFKAIEVALEPSSA